MKREARIVRPLAAAVAAVAVPGRGAGSGGGPARSQATPVAEFGYGGIVDIGVPCNSVSLVGEDIISRSTPTRIYLAVDGRQDVAVTATEELVAYRLP